MSKRKNRKSIYYLLSKATPLRLLSGDTITEFGIMKALSENYDVFYNGELFNPKIEGFGLTRKKYHAIDRRYDVSIVRNNSKVFNVLKGKKIYFAAPYHEESFRQANLIYTFTNSWTNKLKNGYRFSKNLYPKGFKTDKAITLTQVVDDIFYNKRIHAKVAKNRRLIGGNFIIGHFGKVAKSCYPHSFLAILPRLRREFPNLKVIFCGNSERIRYLGKDNDIPIYNFEYKDMPYIISACDLILYNYKDTQGQIAGSMKILEAMACGVPVLCPRYDARVEELGKDYELFYPYENLCDEDGSLIRYRFSPESEEIMYNLIKRGVEEPDWLKDVGRKLLVRSKHYSVDNSAKRFKKIIDGI